MADQVHGKVKSTAQDTLEISTKAKGSSAEFRISGYASKPVIDRVGDVVEVKAFVETMDDFMKNPVMLWMHDATEPIGTWDQYELRPDGLWMSGTVAAGTPAAEKARTLISHKAVRALSIGFRETAGAPDETDNTYHINGLHLYEVSVVSVPANQEALFSTDNGKLLSVDLVPEATEEPPADAEVKDVKTEEPPAEEPKETKDLVDFEPGGDESSEAPPEADPNVVLEEPLAEVEPVVQEPAQTASLEVILGDVKAWQVELRAMVAAVQQTQTELRTMLESMSPPLEAHASALAALDGNLAEVSEQVRTLLASNGSAETRLADLEKCFVKLLKWETLRLAGAVGVTQTGTPAH